MHAQKLYAAFLSHNSKDKPAVEQIARWLEDEAQITVFLDKWSLVRGDPWQEEIEKALDESASCVVFQGPHGIGSWQNEEMRAAMEARVAEKQLRVVPVILPGARRPQKESELPKFLRRLTWVDFRDASDAEALHRLRCGILGIPPGRQPEKAAPAIVCPFRGLEVFREEDAPFFFGRDNVVQQLYDYLQHHRFLAVIGPSGSGKSSVVQAGLIPALKNRGAKSEARKAKDQSSSPSALRPSPLALFTPQADPFEGLAFALRPLMTQPPSYSQLIKDLTANKKELEYIARGICRDTGDVKLLLVIDQFEEVFTQTADEQKRQLFFASLLNTVEVANCPTLIVLTMRSDFLGKCAAYPDLNTFIIDHLFQIGPMPTKDLREAIEEPAHRVGLEFEKGLVEIIVKDAAGAPGELPLIEHALLELYERRSGNQLTQAAYEAIGGISGALAKRAEAEFARLTPAQQEILRKMFVLRLIQPGEGTEDTRRRATKEELLAAGGSAKEAEAVLQHWTQARLLTTTSDQEKKQELVDVAHEALIRTWPKVQDWLKDERENTRLIGQLHQALQEWQQHEKATDYLFRGLQLERFETLLASSYRESLTRSEKEFLDACIAAREAVKRAEIERVQALAEAKKRAERLLTRNYLENGRQAQTDGRLLSALHFITEAVKTAPAGDDICFVAQQNLPEHLFTIRLYQGYQHEGAISGAVFSKDEKRILIWSEDGSARLWSAETGVSIGQPMLHKEEVNGAVFSKDEKRILTWSDDGSACLWNAGTGTPIGQPMQHKENVRGAAFSKDEKRILTWSGTQSDESGSASLWEAETGILIGRPMQHKKIVWGAIFSIDEKRILTWSDDGSACLWNADTGTAIGQPMQHKDKEYVWGAVFSKDEKRILTWSTDGEVRLWEAQTGTAIGQPMQHKDSINGAVFCKDEKHILTWSQDGSARLWQVETGMPIGHPMWHGAGVSGTAFSQDNKRILTWSADGSVRLWQAATGTPVGLPMVHKKNVNGAVFSKDEKCILTWGEDGSARLWKIETDNSINWPIQHKEKVNGAVFSKDEKCILTWSKDGSARLWEAATGIPIGQPVLHETSVLGAVLSQDGKRILTWGNDNAVRLWNAETSTSIGQPMQHERNVCGAVFSKDEKRILTWSGNGVRLWQAETGMPTGQFMQHRENVDGAAFSKNEERILTWSEDGSACLWETETGILIGKPMLHDNIVWGAVFSKDEKRILTWSEDGSARLWDVPGDLDFPNDKYVLQVQALTGTKFDPATRQIAVIPFDEWRKIQQEWLAFAREHAKTCQYKRQNVYLRFWGK